MGKKFLSVILSALIFAYPLSTLAAEANRFEEVCNFYDYANQELINSNRDSFFSSAGEQFAKYYNQASDYIMAHPNDFDPESDIGKVVQAMTYCKEAQGFLANGKVPILLKEGEQYFESPEDIFECNNYNLIVIKSILFLKQTLLYLKEKNTDVFGTDNLEELNNLGDAVAYFEDNLAEILYSIEESLINYINSLPLSDAVKEDICAEILNMQIVDFGFLRSYDYIYDGFSLKDVTLIINKDMSTQSIQENVQNLYNLDEELGEKKNCLYCVQEYALDPLKMNAVNTWELNDWEKNEKYMMDTRKNVIAISTSMIIQFTLNGQDLESDIINLAEVIGHEFGHFVQDYSPCNVDYDGEKYSISDISDCYREYGIYNDSTRDNYNDDYNKYKEKFKDYADHSKEANQKYVSKLQAEDIAYFDDLRNCIKSHFESISLEYEGYNETERMNGDAIYNEVFSDIYGINTAISYMKLCDRTDFEKLFRVHSQRCYRKPFKDLEPNEEKRQELRIHALYGSSSCTYPVDGVARTNGVLTMIPEYVEWAKAEARAYHPEFSATDEATGVQIQADMGKFVDGVSLTVKKLSKDTDTYNTTIANVDDHLKDQIENIDIYSVSVVNRNGNTVQPEDGIGLVKLRIPIPESFDKSDLSALHVAYGDYNDKKHTGTIVNLNGTDYYEFEVQHFSDYALVDELTTYEKMFWPVLISFTVLAVITTSIVLYNKKKKAFFSSK